MKKYTVPNVNKVPIVVLFDDYDEERGEWVAASPKEGFVIAPGETREITIESDLRRGVVMGPEGAVL